MKQLMHGINCFIRVKAGVRWVNCYIGLGYFGSNNVDNACSVIYLIQLTMIILNSFLRNKKEKKGGER